MIVVIGSFIAKEGRRDTALALSLAHTQRSRLEDGCLMFSVNIDAENSNRMVFVEEWRDTAALKSHFKVPECLAVDFHLELTPSLHPNLTPPKAV